MGNLRINCFSFCTANADKASHELKKAGHEVKESADHAAKKTSGFFSRKSHEAAEQVKSATPTLKVTLAHYVPLDDCNVR